MEFKLVSAYTPRGDQATAIQQLVNGLGENEKHQVLLGVTGSGKTFTMAKIVERLNRPTLVLAHNKTLAAQLYQEFRSFFPSNAVEYFVSYYDYYQPEAYIAATDTYIEKESTINDEIDRMRLSATRSLFERRDVLIVASVSCIYGLGSPEAYYGMLLMLEPVNGLHAVKFFPNWSRFFMSEMTSTLSAAAFVCMATRSKFIRLTRISVIASNYGEMMSKRSAHSIHSPAMRSDCSSALRFIQRRISSCRGRGSSRR